MEISESNFADPLLIWESLSPGARLVACTCLVGAGNPIKRQVLNWASGEIDNFDSCLQELSDKGVVRLFGSLDGPSSDSYLYILLEVYFGLVRSASRGNLDDG